MLIFAFDWLISYTEGIVISSPKKLYFTLLLDSHWSHALRCSTCQLATVLIDCITFGLEEGISARLVDVGQNTFLRPPIGMVTGADR